MVCCPLKNNHAQRWRFKKSRFARILMRFWRWEGGCWVRSARPYNASSGFYGVVPSLGKEGGCVYIVVIKQFMICVIFIAVFISLEDSPQFTPFQPGSCVLSYRLGTVIYSTTFTTISLLPLRYLNRLHSFFPSSASFLAKSRGLKAKPSDGRSRRKSGPHLNLHIRIWKRSTVPRQRPATTDQQHRRHPDNTVKMPVRTRRIFHTTSMP